MSVHPMDHRSSLDVPTGRSRKASEGQFTKREPDLEILKRPRYPTPGRPDLDYEPIPKQRQNLITKLEAKKALKSSKTLPRRAVRHVARRTLTGPMAKRREKQRARYERENWAETVPINREQEELTTFSPPMTFDSVFPVFGADGKFPDATTEFNPKEHNYSGPPAMTFNKVMINEPIPLLHMEVLEIEEPEKQAVHEDVPDYLVAPSEDSKAASKPKEIPDQVQRDRLESLNIYPSHVLPRSSAFIYKYKDPTELYRSHKNMYVLPAGYICQEYPNLRDFTEDGGNDGLQPRLLIKAEQMMEVWDTDEKWHVYTIQKGHFFVGNQIFKLPAGVLISRDLLLPMIHFQDYRVIKRDCFFQKKLKQFIEIVDDCTTDKKVQWDDIDMETRAMIINAIQDKELVYLAKHHARRFQCSFYTLIKGFFARFLKLEVVAAMEKFYNKETFRIPHSMIDAKHKIISGMEFYFYFLQRQLFNCYFGPAPPFNADYKLTFTTGIETKEAAQTLKSIRGYKRYGKTRVHGGHKSREPSTLAVESGIDPNAISIDAYGSSMRVDLTPKKAPKWVDPYSLIVIPRYRYPSTGSWETIDTDSEDEDEFNKQPGEDIGEEDDGNESDTTLVGVDLDATLTPSTAGGNRKGRKGRPTSRARHASDSSWATVEEREDLDTTLIEEAPSKPSNRKQKSSKARVGSRTRKGKKSKSRSKSAKGKK